MYDQQPSANPKVDYPLYVNQLKPELQQLFAPSHVMQYGANVQLPMQKVYNINLPGPTGSHVSMNRIYETMLPIKDNRYTYMTVGERLKLCDYVRQVLIRLYDGENISLDSRGDNSLMAYIKFMNLNPNYYSTIHTNPYKGLPNGFVIYNSCFPIKLDVKTNTINCSQNSAGSNIRLYSLTNADYNSHIYRTNNRYTSDVWRELTYYEYIRDNIIKNKISPNFTLIYTYFMCATGQTELYRMGKNKNTQFTQFTNEYKTQEQLYKLNANRQGKQHKQNIQHLNQRNTALPKLIEEREPLLQLYSGYSLIVLTESPTCNLYEWTSRKYETNGLAQTMTSHGYHNYEIWLSIIFQIISALYVMQLHNITLNEMTIEDNIYIKTIQSNGELIGYWKYIIDGISYYVPNYGYVVLIDSNFKDIKANPLMINNDNRKYKIYSNTIYNNYNNEQSIQHLVWLNYKQIITNNAFTKEHTKNNVNKPPHEIIKLFSSMMVDQTEDLGKVILTHLSMFLHNRIGTYLNSDIEVPHIRDNNTILKKGDMVIEVIDDETYKYAVCCCNQLNNKIDILSKFYPDSTDIIIKNIDISLLKKYSPTEFIEHKFVSGEHKISVDNITETYIIG